MSGIRRGGALLLPIVLALASPAFADEAPKPETPTVSDADKARAMSKFDEGSRAFAQRRYKDAIDLFLQADAIVPNAAFAYNAGLAYESMGDVPAALRWSRQYVRRAPQAKDRAEVEERIVRYEAHLRERGLQQVTVRSTPPGATVTIDGKSVGVTPWTGELAPGAHSLLLVLRGYDDDQRPFELDNKRSLDVEATLRASTTAKPAEPPPSKPGTRQVEERSPWMLATSITLLGLGAAGGFAAMGLELKRASLEQDALDEPQQVAANDIYDSMESFQLASRAVAGVAAGLGLAGGIMLIIDRASASSSAEATALSRVHVAGGCDGTGCRAGLAYDF
jgi:tetratricopeptide (TPR) repeat protein